MTETGKCRSDTNVRTTVSVSRRVISSMIVFSTKVRKYGKLDGTLDIFFNFLILPRVKRDNNLLLPEI